MAASPTMQTAWENRIAEIFESSRRKLKAWHSQSQDHPPYKTRESCVQPHVISAIILCMSPAVPYFEFGRAQRSTSITSVSTMVSRPLQHANRNLWRSTRKRSFHTSASTNIYLYVLVARSIASSRPISLRNAIGRRSTKLRKACD